jgi:hypothetical protein
MIVVAIGLAEAGALHHSHHVAMFEIAAPEKDCAAALEELAGVLDSQHAEHMAQSVLLPLDDASLWLCSRVQPSTRWILAGFLLKRKSRGDASDIPRQVRFDPLPLLIAAKTGSFARSQSPSKNESGSHCQSEKINEF